jgi:transcriptional regulator with XRE-family HTH domain
MERRTIRALRSAAGMTQRQLAEAMAVNHMSIYHWESGRNEPSARQLRALAEVFAVPMESIAFERDTAGADRAKGKEGDHGN